MIDNIPHASNCVAPKSEVQRTRTIWESVVGKMVEWVHGCPTCGETVMSERFEAFEAATGQRRRRLRTEILMAEALERAACRVKGYRKLVGDRCGKDYCDSCIALAEFEKLFPEEKK